MQWRALRGGKGIKAKASSLISPSNDCAANGGSERRWVVESNAERLVASSNEPDFALLPLSPRKAHHCTRRVSRSPPSFSSSAAGWLSLSSVSVWSSGAAGAPLPPQQKEKGWLVEWRVRVARLSRFFPPLPPPAPLLLSSLRGLRAVLFGLPLPQLLRASFACFVSQRSTARWPPNNNNQQKACCSFSVRALSRCLGWSLRVCAREVDRSIGSVSLSVCE